MAFRPSPRQFPADRLLRPGTILAAGLVLALGIAATFGFLVWRSIGDNQEQTDRRTLAITRLSALSVSRTLEAVEGHLEVLTEAARAADGPDLDALVDETLRFAPHIRQLAVVVAGRVVVDSTGATTAIDLARLGLPPTGGNLMGSRLRIGRPIAGRYLPRVGPPPAASRRSVLPVAMTAGDGAQSVTVIMALNPAYLGAVLRQARLGPRGVAALTRFDGTPLTVSGPAPDRFPDLATPVAEGDESGLLGPAPSEMTGTVTAFALSARYPVAVVSLYQRGDVVADWIAANRAALLWSGAVLAALLLLAMVLVRQLSIRLRLQAEKRLLSQAVEQADTPVIVTDPGGRFVYVNGAFTRQTGWPAAEVLGQTARLLKSGLTPESTYRELWAALDRGEVWTGAFINRHQDGHLIHDLSTISPLRDADGRVTHLVCTKLDVTALKAAEAEREQLIAALRRANADLQRFAEVSAHHLQEPVRRILTFAGLLAGGDHRPATPDQAIRFLAGIQEQSATLHALIADIQQYLAAGEPHPGGTHASITEVWAAVRDGRAAELAELDAELVVPDRAPAPALEAPRLHRLIGQLLDNALKYRHPERALRVVVTVATEGDRVVMTVADNGVGIPAAYRDRVFEVFERLEAGRGGTGIGLALVRRMAESVGGTVTIADGLDGGTALVVTLPLLDDADRPDPG